MTTYQREIFGVFREDRLTERDTIHNDLKEMYSSVGGLNFQRGLWANRSNRAQLIHALNNNISFTYIGTQHIVEYYNGVATKVRT